MNRNLALRQVDGPDAGRQTAARRQRLPNCRDAAAGRAPSAKGQATGCPHPAANRLHVGPWACNDGAGGGWLANLGTGWAWTRRLDEAHRFRDRHLPNGPRPLHPSMPSQPHVVPVPVVALTALVSHVVAVPKDWRLQHLDRSRVVQPRRRPVLQGSRGWMDGCRTRVWDPGPRPCPDPDCSRPPEAIGYEGSTSSLSAHDRRPSLLPLTCLLSAPSPPQTPSPPSPRALGPARRWRATGRNETTRESLLTLTRAAQCQCQCQCQCQYQCQCRVQGQANLSVSLLTPPDGTRLIQRNSAIVPCPSSHCLPRLLRRQPRRHNGYMTAVFFSFPCHPQLV